MSTVGRYGARMSLVLRTLAAAAVAATAITLSACAGGPAVPSGDTSQSAASFLTGQTWGGTDSDGDVWSFEFQSDGTLGFTYNGSSYDDATDTWVVEGGQLEIFIAFEDGDTTMVGPVGSEGEPIDLDGTQTDGTASASWTVTIAPE